jgi:two-component system, LuxR family, sensor kinase FixL
MNTARRVGGSAVRWGRSPARMQIQPQTENPEQFTRHHLRAFFQLVPVAMVMADRTGTIRAASQRTGELFGYTEQELIGQNVKVLLGSPHRERHDGYLARYHETGERRIIGNPRVENAQHRNGHAIAVEVTIGETEWEGEQLYLGVLRPLEATESNRQQIQTMLSELSHMSRISAMGALATAIAHELNQPLSVISNFTEGAREILRKRADADELAEVIDVLEKCGQQAVRAGQLLHRLRDFVRSGSPLKSAVAVEEVVDASISLALINGYRRTVTIDRRVEPGIPLLGIDPLQGEQVLFNLIRNAFEAMEQVSGRPHRLIICVRRKSAGFVEFAVEDAGPGIDPDIRNTLFTSFVTTKAGGMGLGLPICRQIVEAYGGRLDNEPPLELEGARFVFTLPTVAGEQEAGEGGGS